MTELLRIIGAFEQGQMELPPVLATVVKTSGSTYRRPGARMLITPLGQVFGAVSGGCLERDVMRQAQRVFLSGRSRLVTYDSTADDEICWGWGLGCNGMVHVLLEEMRDGAQMEFLARCQRERRDGVLVKIFAVSGAIEAKPGDFLWLGDGFVAQSNIGETALTDAVLADAMDVLETGKSLVKLFETKTGRAEVFIEAIRPPMPLVIFGGGHDAVPLARIAKDLGWHVTIVDGRLGYASQAKFPAVDALIAARPETISNRVAIDDRSIAVVMNYNYLDDLATLRALLPTPLTYIGLLGPRRRTEKLLEDLKAEGAPMPSHWTSRLYGPVGLDIGADTPEEIAVAIVAEITAVLAGRAGGLSRDRSGPLHRRDQHHNGQVDGDPACAADQSLTRRREVPKPDDFCSHPEARS